MALLTDEQVGLLPVVSPQEQFNRDQVALQVKQGEMTEPGVNVDALLKDISHSRQQLAKSKAAGAVEQPVAKSKLMTDAEVGLKTDFGPMPSWDPKDNLRETLKSAGYSALGNVASLADMFAGLPGMAMQVGAYGQARQMMIEQGESPRIAARAAKEVAADLVPDALMHPFQKVMESLGYGDQYNDSTVSKAMSVVSEGIEKGSAWFADKTKGALQPEDVETLVNAAMVWGGAKGGDVAMKKALIDKKKIVDEKPAAPERVEPTTQQPPQQPAVDPAALAKQHVEGRYADPNLAGKAAQQYWRQSTRAARAAFPDDTQYAAYTKALAAERALRKTPQTQPTAAPAEGVSQNGTPVPIAEAAFRNPETGEILRQGQKHTEALKQTNLEQGFVDEQGNWLDRQSAATRAWETGQLQPGDRMFRPSEGLHSGDIWRKGELAGKPKIKLRVPPNAAAGAAAVAAGGWLYMHPDQAEEIGLGGLVAAGAIKGKGGMWHPEAVTRLADPLASKLVRPGEPGDTFKGVQARIDAAQEWSNKAIRNYLNKHAGTPTDPLKDVKVPMMGEDVRWEDLTDQVIKSRPADYYAPQGGFEDKTIQALIKLAPRELQEAARRRPDEPVWNIKDSMAGGVNALTSYLSHVGDYLREFVPVDKLQNYDLVRAVRETAEQDAKQAAKMAKARVNQAGTVTFKEYPDGMKWVEVGKGADKATNEAALRNEGDVMGHCVGGYCEAVHAGESRIFSLRDPKGMSHVTIEVEPPKSPTYHRDNPNLKMSLGHEQPNILQIKGKQNRAPVAAYLPYVQDFVKSGKWGEVGDLENAGLYPISGKSGSVYPRELSASLVNPQELGLPPGYYTKEEIISAHEKAAKRLGYNEETGQAFYGGKDQAGKVDPQLLKQLGAVTAGAALGGLYDKKDPLWGAVVGGVAGLLTSSRTDTRIRIKKQMDARDALIAKSDLERSRDLSYIANLVPDKAGRGRIAHAIENNTVDTLVPVEKAAAIRAKKFFERMGEIGVKHEVLHDLLSNYVTHVFGKEAKGLVDQFLSERKGSGAIGTRFAQKRVGPATIAEFNKWLTDHGAKPITDDIAVIMDTYGKSLINAVANKQVLDTLGSVTTPMKIKGKDVAQALVVKVKDKGVPPGFKDFGKMGYVAHPDIVAPLRFLFDQDTPAGIMRGLEMVNTGLKRSVVSFSGFHAASLLQAFVGAAKMQWQYPIGGAAAGAAYAYMTGKDDPITYAMIAGGSAGLIPGLRIVGQAAKPFKKAAPIVGGLAGYGLASDDNKLAGTLAGVAVGLLPRTAAENKYLRGLQGRDPVMAAKIDQLIQNGLKVSFEKGGLAVEDISNSFYQGLTSAQNFLDKHVPVVGGKPIEGLIALNRNVDAFMWERLHTMFKLEVGMAKYEELLRNNVEANKANPQKVPLKSQAELAEIAASYTNDIFGGLDWRRAAEQARTRFGRDVTQFAYSPKGRRVLQLLDFAPDWLIATTRAATQSFRAGTGLKGVFTPRELGDLHRQYMLRSAFYYTMIGDGLNYAFTGKHLWQNTDSDGNADPFHVYTGDGNQRINISKHATDPYELALHPTKTLLSKMSVPLKEAANQLMHTEYLTTRETPLYKGGPQPPFVGGPPMEGSRVMHALKAAAPISASQAFGSGGQAGTLSTLGVGVYGKTKQQRAEDKQKRENEKRRKRNEALRRSLGAGE